MGIFYFGHDSSSGAVDFEVHDREGSTHETTNGAQQHSWSKHYHIDWDGVAHLQTVSGTELIYIVIEQVQKKNINKGIPFVLTLNIMYLFVWNKPNTCFSLNDSMDELKRSAVNVDNMQQKKIIQPNFMLQKDDTSSMAKSSPPTGAPKAAATPAAAPAVVKFRLLNKESIAFIFGWWYIPLICFVYGML